ncbi:2,4-diaminopentanoate dehydrogenase [uncultured Roseovarius sp.]|uniref:2,4-diaminopentanoate dehydrogenase n=1 Tax=uncultured Roseovarius sp. TaxID=293344 RepID=UPI0026019BBA|nr:2,4-diaminopentanoate dehydrogenase [uncultured Roseovarius sp.]
MEKIKIAIWGFGAMGSGMARMLLNKKGVEIVAVCDLAQDRVGRSMFDILGEEQRVHPDVVVMDDPEDVFQEGVADVLLLATDSFTHSAFDKVVLGLKRRMNVISTAEEMAFPKIQEPELAEQLDEIAQQYGVSVLGTGINPGFVLDYLVLALTGTCETVDHIKAVRVNDLSPFGATVMREQGVGTTIDAFNKGVEIGTISGHVGFPESIGMIAEGLGWDLEKVSESREAIVSNVHREAPFAEVSAGDVAGCRQRGEGYVDGEAKIEMEHPQQIMPQVEGIETGDVIEIRGTPDISMKIGPEIPGGIGTIAMCVNMIPQVINSDPGLRTMLDLPVPRAIMGDFRDQVRAEKRLKTTA